MEDKRILSCVLLVLISIFIGESFCQNCIPVSVAAQVNDIGYVYDTVGRLTLVTYPDGEQIQYEYDVNGNITSYVVMQKQVDMNDKDNSGNAGENDKQFDIWGKGLISVERELRQFSSMYETPQDKKIYKKFKKKKPIVKSIKQIEKREKNYLLIQVKKMNGLGKYIENGYEVKYATNKKFNKAKTIKIAKNGAVTGEKWSVKKGKTYWIKVRAYMKTKKGKTIYSRYSKVVSRKIS